MITPEYVGVEAVIGSSEIGPKLPNARLICSRVPAKSPSTAFEETPNHSTKSTKKPAISKETCGEVLIHTRVLAREASLEAGGGRRDSLTRPICSLVHLFKAKGKQSSALPGTNGGEPWLNWHDERPAACTSFTIRRLFPLQNRAGTGQAVPLARTACGTGCLVLPFSVRRTGAGTTKLAQTPSSRVPARGSRASASTLSRSEVQTYRSRTIREKIATPGR